MGREKIRPKLEIRPAKLVDLVEYQVGSVVSREIISGTGSVSLFAFDAGQRLREHTAPFDALAYIIDGEAEITISGRPYNVKVGEAIIIPSDEPHKVNAVERFKMLLTMIRS